MQNRHLDSVLAAIIDKGTGRNISAFPTDLQNLATLLRRNGFVTCLNYLSANTDSDSQSGSESRRAQLQLLDIALGCEPILLNRMDILKPELPLQKRLYAQQICVDTLISLSRYYKARNTGESESNSAKFLSSVGFIKSIAANPELVQFCKALPAMLATQGLVPVNLFALSKPAGNTKHRTLLEWLANEIDKQPNAGASAKQYINPQQSTPDTLEQKRWIEHQFQQQAIALSRLVQAQVEWDTVEKQFESEQPG